MNNFETIFPRFNKQFFKIKYQKNNLEANFIIEPDRPNILCFSWLRVESEDKKNDEWFVAR